MKNSTLLIALIHFCWFFFLSSDAVVFCVRDNGANIKAAVNGTDWHDLPCFAHTLQLVIRGAIQENDGINNMVTRMKKMVGHYSHSQVTRTRLQKACNEIDLPYLAPVQSVVTRWNSEYEMVERSLYLKEAFINDLKSVGLTEFLPTATEWKLAESFKTILKDFTECCTELCGENYPTRCKIIIWLFNLGNTLDSFIELADRGSGITFARTLKKNLGNRFPEYRNQSPDHMCAYVDPR